MREIKFRAFNTSDKEMYSDAMAKQLLYMESIGESIPERFKIMQFTGLHDRNGKEIYEGDIVRYPAKDKWEEINYSCYEVFFHDGDANSDYNIGFSINRMFNHGGVCGGYIPSFKPKSIKQMVVIGNIYENPELLNK